MSTTDWADFLPLSVVMTQKGQGVIVAFDTIANTVSVSIEGLGVELFKPESISWKFGTVKPGISFQVGQFILIFQQLENATKNFIRNMNLCDEDISKLTAGQLTKKFNDCLTKKSDTLGLELLQRWGELGTTLKNMSDFRNDLIHGQRFELPCDVSRGTPETNIFYNQGYERGHNLTVADLQDLYDRQWRFLNDVGDCLKIGRKENL